MKCLKIRSCLVFRFTFSRTARNALAACSGKAYREAHSAWRERSEGKSVPAFCMTAYAWRMAAMAAAMSGARKVEDPATMTFAPAAKLRAAVAASIPPSTSMWNDRFLL